LADNAPLKKQKNDVSLLFNMGNQFFKKIVWPKRPDKIYCPPCCSAARKKLFLIFLLAKKKFDQGVKPIGPLSQDI